MDNASLTFHAQENSGGQFGLPRNQRSYEKGIGERVCLCVWGGGTRLWDADGKATILSRALPASAPHGYMHSLTGSKAEKSVRVKPARLNRSVLQHKATGFSRTLGHKG